jgi:cellulose synthase/poly-beta-1,6-N-acetylglucosamine synthase-like glycosyltransferase
MSDSLPRFDVVIPAFNEEHHIGAALDHVVSQDYPGELIQIYVVDAGSTDRTAEVVGQWASSDERIHLISGRGRLNAGEALNAGIEAGASELIARVDAHTYIEPDYLRMAAAQFQSVDGDVALIGGQPLQVGETPFGEAVSLARRSGFGVGNSVYADQRQHAFVETVQGGVYRRSALAEIGGFASNMLVSEDEECAFRLTEAGHRVLLDTSLRFRYTTRSSWWALFRQHMNYGRSRVRVLRAHPRSLRVRYLVPGAFVASLLSLAAVSPWSRLARRLLCGLLGIYGVAAVGAAAKAARAERRHTLRVVGCFTAQHLGYGIGLFRGMTSAISEKLGLRPAQGAVSRR